MKLYVNQSKKKSVSYPIKQRIAYVRGKKLCMRLGSVLFLLFAYDQESFTCCIKLEYLMYKLSWCIYIYTNKHARYYYNHSSQ